jgi:hypothetical protein
MDYQVKEAIKIHLFINNFDRNNGFIFSWMSYMHLIRLIAPTYFMNISSSVKSFQVHTEDVVSIYSPENCSAQQLVRVTTYSINS